MGSDFIISMNCNGGTCTSYIDTSTLIELLRVGHIFGEFNKYFLQHFNLDIDVIHGKFMLFRSIIAKHQIQINVNITTYSYSS